MSQGSFAENLNWKSVFEIRSSHFALVSVFTSKQFKSFENAQNQTKIFFYDSK